MLNIALLVAHIFVDYTLIMKHPSILYCPTYLKILWIFRPSSKIRTLWLKNIELMPPCPHPSVSVIILKKQHIKCTNCTFLGANKVHLIFSIASLSSRKNNMKSMIKIFLNIFQMFTLKLSSKKIFHTNTDAQILILFQNLWRGCGLTWRRTTCRILRTSSGSRRIRRWPRSLVLRR